MRVPRRFRGWQDFSILLPENSVLLNKSRNTYPPLTDKCSSASTHLFALFLRKFQAVCQSLGHGWLSFSGKVLKSEARFGIGEEFCGLARRLSAGRFPRDGPGLQR